MPMSNPTRRSAAALRYLAAIPALLWWLSCAAQVTLNAVPGGLVEVPLASLNRPRPQAFFGRERVLVMRFGRQWVGLVGLPLTLVPGSYLIRARLEDGQDAVSRQFTVYPRQEEEPPVVHVRQPPLDAPPAALTWREPLDAKLPLEPPVPLPAQPVFGHYRETADSRTGLRSAYVDFVTFQVASDTAVKAPDDGVVAGIEIRDSGAYVLIDHGMGLFSRVGPVTRTELQVSQPVKAGQMIGRMVLDTADKSKPLYWWVFLNGAAVNPFLMSRIEKAPIRDAGSGTSPG
jgi:hypothetical protein